MENLNFDEERFKQLKESLDSSKEEISKNRQTIRTLLFVITILLILHLIITKIKW